MSIHLETPKCVHDMYYVYVVEKSPNGFVHQTLGRLYRCWKCQMIEDDNGAEVHLK